MNPQYDWPTNELIPCQCGFKPDHYSIYYSSTPYDVYCPTCKKQLNFARCKVTGWHGHAIDYWNSHLAALTFEEMEEESRKFREERKKMEDREGARAREYAYYWEKDKGEVLYQRW